MIRRPPRSTLSSSSAASDVYKRQTQSGAFAFFLGGEERFEDPRLGFVVHARARVGHLDLDVGTRTKWREFDRLRLDHYIAGGNPNSAAQPHGVSGIHHQIQDYLLQLAAIRLDVR